MSKNYILQTGENNKILRTQSIPINEINKEIKKFAKILTELMYERDGVWLAAPQVWENIRMISTTQRKKSKRNDKDQIIKETIMINPEIIEKSTEQKTWEEACLSLPWVFGNVKRHTKITVKYTDTNWIIHTKKFKDFDAIVIQHELDHLDWILFVDKIIKK